MHHKQNKSIIILFKSNNTSINIPYIYLGNFFHSNVDKTIRCNQNLNILSCFFYLASLTQFKPILLYNFLLFRCSLMPFECPLLHPIVPNIERRRQSIGHSPTESMSFGVWHREERVNCRRSTAFGAESDSR